ncbi:MAG TPA: radical SAM protein [Patescibacteria group bacterium]|nr:radical SAM protein [Patescibacteria group bacterium]
MKASRYNRLFQTSDGAWLAFNSWSTALAEIEPENLSFFRAMCADPDGVPCDTAEKREIREAMVEAHFLIEDEMDELATLKADILRDRFSRQYMYLTVAPTLNCNFRCDYCYEEHLKITMPRAIEEALVRWVEKRVRTVDELHVTWYGGEPLLPGAYAVVQRLSESFAGLAGERDMKYSAHLVTNGYLLDRPKMEALAGMGVDLVQVTLDGPPDIHDKRRHLVGGHGTFRRIIENLKATVDLAEFQLRINIDRRNAVSALEVVEILEKEGLGGKVRPHLAQVITGGGTCGNIHEMCYSSEDFAQMEMEIYREALGRGLHIARYPFRIPGAYCTSDRMNAYVIAPNGSIFKCWHEVTMNPDKSIGSLLDEQEPYQKYNEDHWLRWDALEKEGCRSCDILPMCHGGCPLEAMKHPDRDRGACEHYKFHLEHLLELRYRAEAGGIEEARRPAPGGCDS